MFKKKSLRLISSFSLVLILFMFTIVPSFADNGTIVKTDDLQMNISVINDNNVINSENGERILITESENKNVSTTTLKNLETGNEDYFLRDEIEGTIYSSITGNTISIDDSTDIGSPAPLAKQKFLGIRKISYSTILTLCGVGASMSTAAAAVLKYYKIPIGAGIKTIVIVLGALAAATVGILSVKYPKGGLQLDLYEVEKSLVRDSIRYYYWERTYKNVKHSSVLS